MDWESGVAGKNCTLAKKAAFKPPPTCPPPRRNVSRAEASKLGPRFAPILYQHPLENSFLTDPPKFFVQGRKYAGAQWSPINITEETFQSNPYGNNTAGILEYLCNSDFSMTRLATPIYNTTDGKVTFNVSSGATIAEKAVIDPVVDGKLTGKVYYTVFRPHVIGTGDIIPYAYVFTYNFYYPWNGCSNQLVATQVDGKRQGVEYYMCTDGVHEADLEHLKVWVCEDDLYDADPASVIRRAQYSQHGWLPDFDCAAGECSFEVDPKGQKRLVTYAGLFSHSNWPQPTPLFVYQKVKVDFILNMDGVYIGDRYAKGAVFYPDENNTLFLPFLSEMNNSQLTGEFAWASFPGVWGATLSGTSRTITCLGDNITKEVPCTTQNPAYYMLDLIVKPIGGDWTQINFTAKTQGNTVTGPLWDRTFTHNWEVERQAPLWSGVSAGGLNMAFDGLCPLTGPIVTSYETMGTFYHTSLKEFLGAITGLVLASSIICFAMVLPILMVRGKTKQEENLYTQLLDELLKPPPALAAKVADEKDPSAALGPASSTSPTPKQQEATTALLTYMRVSHKLILHAFNASVVQPYLLVVWICVGLACYICGVVLGALGIADVTTALNGVAPSSIWQTLDHAIIVVFAIFGLVSLMVIITALFIRPTASRLCRCCGPAVPTLNSMRMSWRAHAIMAGLLTIEMNVTMLLFAYGLIIWVARYGIQEVCSAAVEALFSTVGFAEDLCVDLSNIGLTKIGNDGKICGADLINVCSLWSDLHVDFLEYGAMLLLMAQAMFLVLASTSYVAMRAGAAITAAMAKIEEDERDSLAGASGASKSWISWAALRRRSRDTEPPAAVAARPKSAPVLAGGKVDTDAPALGPGAQPFMDRV
ncbi:hypothetical protein HYH03_015904 [Edaphochlamys debaryana]|uniref:Uncharacterized protein n=1 Tax=Edaphochlamys debaryana TaxID=47281 RepID=A0A836BQS0_9CHLO|nr:hypothetical protein HYH03_015904 [Edaphochlamys debaryana]|eukprot:KAG2485322.1 hypothetical protein HYH03_015904 [Edaphochlamys debaryana]